MTLSFKDINLYTDERKYTYEIYKTLDIPILNELINIKPSKNERIEEICTFLKRNIGNLEIKRYVKIFYDVNLEANDFLFIKSEILFKNFDTLKLNKKEKISSQMEKLENKLNEGEENDEQQKQIFKKFPDFKKKKIKVNISGRVTIY